MKVFKLFLLRVVEFYRNLIFKVRGYYYKGFFEEFGGKSRFLCYCFYICFGDLERYREQYLKIYGYCDWLILVIYYFEVVKFWFDSGNFYNQVI